MLVLKERITEMPIMSLQTGAQIAVTAEPIIDPRELKIVAFYCQGPHLDSTPAILHVDDIREISHLGLIVDDAESIMSPEGLVRLQQVIGFNFTLEGKTAVEESGRKIGKVTNYTVDIPLFYITQLHVQPSIFKSWGMAEVIIGRNQIKEITDSKIVVRSATVKERAPVHARRLAQNPFRSHPQTEATHSSQD